MKKLFTMILMVFAAMAVNAQTATVILDNTADVWGDGTGYQLLIDADNAAYTATFGPDCGTAYTDWEYMIPANASATDAAAVAGTAQSIEIPAGTYSYLILNPSCTGYGQNYIASSQCDSAKATNYTFEAGKIYRFTMSMLANGNDCVTLTITNVPTVPTIDVVSTLDLGSAIYPNPMVTSTIVNGWLLSSPITVTATAPFAVSADGTTFASTATLPAAGDTLYIQCAPTAAGIATGTVTLTSGSVTETITCTANAFDCSTVTTFPFSYDFSNEDMFDCWQVVDVNNDGKTWTLDAANNCARYTYSAANAANDWLISPEFTLTGSQYLSFEHYGSSNYPEKFSVSLIQNDTTYIQIMPQTTTGSSAFLSQVIDLSNYSGDYRIGFHAESDADQLHLRIRNFMVANSESSFSVNPTAVDFGTTQTGNTVNRMVTIQSLYVTDDVVASTNAPFELSLDGTTFATTVTIPAPAESIAADTLYVRYAPTVGGTDNGTITFTSDEVDLTVDLTGAAVVCEVITDFPYVFGFDDAQMAQCWSIVDQNNDGSTWIIATSQGLSGYVYNANNAADDYMISPTFTFTGNELLRFDYATMGYPEKFSVYALANGTYTQIHPQVTTTAAAYITLNVSLASLVGDYQIAIHAESDADMYQLLVDNFTIITMEPTMTVNTESMSFAAALPNASAAQVANVETIVITEPINVTATAPFEVSLDGNTYGATVTIPASTEDIANVSVYVRYAPTAAGSDNGTVTFTAGTLTATINVTGNAFDCSEVITLPYTQDFESELSVCWANIDNDGDGFVWLNTAVMAPGNGMGYNSDGAMISFSYDNDSYSALTPDNFLVTPQIAIPAAGAQMTWYVAAQDPDYAAEYYEVLVSTTTTDPSAFTSIFNETLSSGDWAMRSVNLDYAGQNIYIAFRHTNCTDMFAMKIDDLSISEGMGVVEQTANVRIYPNPTINVLNVEAAGFNTVEISNLLGQVVYSTDMNDNAQINVSNLESGVYFVRLNGANGTSTQKFIKK